MMGVYGTTAVLIMLLWVVYLWQRYRRASLIGRVAVVTLPGFASRHLGNAREIQVFLPPGYERGGPGEREAYPVLYLNDGQDVVALGLRETVARLCQQGRIRPLLVVAIPTNEARLQDYGTAVTVNAQGLGSRAGLYAQFVLTELMPQINRQFRTCTEAAETAVWGASLGGLSAFDMAWNHPEVFGVVGVFSGSFWWRAGAEEGDIPPGRLIAHEMVRNGRYHSAQRFWFEAATQDETDDRDQNGVIDAIQDTQELIDELVALGHRRDRDVVYWEVAGGRHNYDTWSAVLPEFLRWAFPPAEG